MKLSEYLKENKGFFICAIAVVLFFAYLMINQYLKIQQIENGYREEIESLRSLVNVTNIGKSPELQFDIYQSAEDFFSYYYGVSSGLTSEYRETQLQQLMTEEAFNKYGQKEYNNTIGCEITITDIQTYVDFKKSSKERVYACVFFYENIKWPKIDAITLKKYWQGSFVYDESVEKYVLEDIIDCQELLTREEFNALNMDTNGTTLEQQTMKGSDADAIAIEGAQESP